MTHPFERGLVKCSISHPSGGLNYLDMMRFTEQVQFESFKTETTQEDRLTNKVISKEAYISFENIDILRKEKYEIKIVDYG